MSGAGERVNEAGVSRAGERVSEAGVSRAGEQVGAVGARWEQTSEADVSGARAEQIKRAMSRADEQSR
eukprot:7384350-Prymnesium_polylepis.1